MGKPLTDEQREKKRIADAARYQRQRERQIARTRAWKEANKERVQEYKKQYRKENADKIAEYNENNKDRQAEWRESHREMAAAYAKQYRKDNNKIISQKKREKYLANSEEVKAKRREWYYANIDQARESIRRHRIANPKMYAVYAHNKRIRKKQGEGKLSNGIIDILMQEQGCKCPYCLVDLRISGHHIDHYVPLAMGGPNQDGNVQLTCPTCNAKKGAKNPLDFLEKTVRLT